MGNQQTDSASLESKIKAEAFRLGFSLCGFTSPDSPEGFQRFEKWLSNGQQASMAYLDTPRHRVLRQHPEQLVPGVKTIISLGWPYPLTQSDRKKTSLNAIIAGYTNRMDYHLTLPPLMDQLMSFIQNEAGIVIKAQGFTDSAPILEREIASRAGLGWIGKNSCLISPEIGSAFLLSELFIDILLQPDHAFTVDRCGSCHRCLDACPTGCIQPDRTIDSNRCISFLTIENKGIIADELRSSLGQWLFGCDICQTVCPWNKRIPIESFIPNGQKWSIEDVQSLLSMTSDEFTSQYKEQAIYRSKLKGLQRNALIWLGNNHITNSVPKIELFVRQTVDSDLIDCAKWAIKKINQM